MKGIKHSSRVLGIVWGELDRTHWPCRVARRGTAWRRWMAVALGSLLLLCKTIYAVPLPQNHPYQVILRNYLASLSEQDFELPLSPLVYNPTYLTSEDDWYRTWLLTGFYSTPRLDGLRYPASQFTLQTIEGDANNVMLPYRWAHEIAWWAQWNYPGNPYYNSRAVKLRAFVSAVVDLIMLDDAHERGLYRRADFLGGTLIWLGYAYGVSKDVLPAEVRSAYETGLMKLFERMEQWGPTGAFGDMDAMGIVGMVYTAQAIGDPNLLDRAYAYAQRVVNTVLNEGMERHQGGYDASYNGIALFFVSWAALATGWELLEQVADQMSEVKAYQTLPEPGNTFYGPSHYSSNTSADVANDQWSGSPPRDVALAMLSDHAVYLAFGGRSGRTWAWAVPTISAMQQGVSRWMNSINSALTQLPAAPIAWGERHWIRSESSTYVSDHYRAGTYQRFVQLLQSNSPLTLPPFKRDSVFINHLLGTRAFLSAKYSDYGVIVYTGRLSWQVDPIAGFGGGTLSAFWTPQTGSVILGRRRGFQGPNIDRWEEWRSWPVNAMSGLTPAGKIFTTARYRPSWDDRSYIIGDNWAVVTMMGAINSAYTEQDNALPGDFQFMRRFIIEPRGVTAEIGFASHCLNQAVELYEAIPLFLRDAVRQSNVPHKVWFRINGQWTEITSTDLYIGVEQIKVERFSGAVRILFESPQRVRLSEQWGDGFQSGAICRNILIDLLGNEGQPVTLPMQFSFRYRIAPVIKADVDEDGCVGDSDLLQVLLHFGCTSSCGGADINSDGIVDDADLLIVLQNFGAGC